MSFLSILGGIGKGILGGVTGGALGEIGKVSSGAAQGAANQRGSEADLALRRYIAESQQNNNAAQFGQTQARDAFTTGLQGSQFGASEQQRGMRNALVAQLLGGMQDAKLTGGSGRIPQMSVTGGLKPSTLDAGGLQIPGAGGGAPTSSTRQALMAQLSAPTMQAPTYTPGAAMQTTPMPQAPTAGFGEKLLGGVGLGGSLLGILGQLANKKQGVPMFGNAPSGMTAPRYA